jgi:hypothetical protein
MNTILFRVALLAALCLVGSSAGVVVGQQTTTPPAPDAWTPVIEEVISRLPVNIPGAVIQVLTLPMPANWNDPRFGNHYLWEVLANQIPEWGPSSEPSRTYWASRRRVTDEYRLFVTSLALPLPDKGAQKQALKARDKYLKTLQKIDSVTKDRRSWQNGKLSTRAQRQIDDLRNDASTHAARYAAFLNQAHQGFGAAGDLLIDLDNPAYQRPAMSPDGLTLTYRTFSVTPRSDRLDCCRSASTADDVRNRYGELGAVAADCARAIQTSRRRHTRSGDGGTRHRSAVDGPIVEADDWPKRYRPGFRHREQPRAPGAAYRYLHDLPRTLVQRERALILS